MEMGKRVIQWIWRYRKSVAIGLVVVSILCLNLVAYMHAWAMTHLLASGTRTENPQSLSLPRKLAVLVAGVRVPKPCNTLSLDAIGLEFETHRIDGNCGEIEA